MIGDIQINENTCFHSCGNGFELECSQHTRSHRNRPSHSIAQFTTIDRSHLQLIELHAEVSHRSLDPRRIKSKVLSHNCDGTNTAIARNGTKSDSVIYDQTNMFMHSSVRCCNSMANLRRKRNRHWPNDACNVVWRRGDIKRERIRCDLIHRTRDCT